MKALTKWWMVGMLALALVGSACGDDTEEPGTDAGADTGVTDTGVTDTGVADTGAGDDAGGGECSLLPPEGTEPTACQECTAAMCGSEFRACNEDPDCCGIVVCGVEAGCGTDQGCFVSMCGQYFAGATLGTMLGNCVTMNCAEACSDPAE